MYEDVGGGGVMHVRVWEADSLCMSLMSDELSLRTSRTEYLIPVTRICYQKKVP